MVCAPWSSRRLLSVMNKKSHSHFHTEIILNYTNYKLFLSSLNMVQGFLTYPEKFTRCQSFGDEITKSTKQSLQFFLEIWQLSKIIHNESSYSLAPRSPPPHFFIKFQIIYKSPNWCSLKHRGGFSLKNCSAWHYFEEIWHFSAQNWRF